MSKALQRRLDRFKAQDWRRKAFKKQNGHCAYCDRAMVLDPPSPNFRVSQQATLDHKLPLSRGGEHHWENIVAACNSCNGRKGSMTAAEFCPEKFAALVCEATE